MGKRTGPTNPLLKLLIEDLTQHSIRIGSPFLKEIAEKLNKPRRQRVEVNIADIERNTNEGDVVVVPGIVLGYGELTKPITVGAWKFSQPAKEKINKNKGQALSILALVKKHPRGTNVKIVC